MTNPSKMPDSNPTNMEVKYEELRALAEAAEDVVERAAKIIQRGTEPGLHPKEAATQIAIMLDEASLLRAPEADVEHWKGIAEYEHRRANNLVAERDALLRAPEAGLTHEKVHDETVKICAAMVEPDGPPHCDCAKYSDGMWEYHCTCGNFDDCARVSNWCSDMNTSERMRSLKWNP